ncbi:peptidoglycan-binding domain-containing protein [Bartonella sp. B23]
MTKKTKTRKTKTVKKHKQYSSFVVTFFLMSGRFLFWTAKMLYFYTRKNTLFFVGTFLFIISFGFVSFNALFLQMIMHEDVFAKMKFTFAPDMEQNSPLFKKKAKLHAVSRVTSVPFSNHLHKNPLSHSPSKNTLKMQKKLAKLGLYDGSLDGVEGPKMRQAIVLWKQQAAQEVQSDILPDSTADEVAVLIKQSEIEMANETTKTKDVSHSKNTTLKPLAASTTQVQKALRTFGNQDVIVTGIEDQKTREALKQFQKIFDLPITGKVDHAVLTKMHEVGLLN